MFTNSGCIHQFAAGITVCFVNFFYGIAGSWTSPFQSLLLSNGSPVGPLTHSQISWIGSVPALGAITGALFWPIVIDMVGRKNTILINIVPYFVCNLILYMSPSYIFLIIARFLSGIGIVGSMVNNSSYIAEISEDKYKGILVSILIVTINAGSLTIVIGGSLISYALVNLITTIGCALVFILLMFIPESPVHLLRMGDEDGAKEMLKWLRSTEDETVLKRELNKLKASFLDASQSTHKLTIREVVDSPYYLKVLIIGLFLQSGITLSGITVMMGYTNDVVERTVSDTTAGKYAFFLILTQNVGSCLMILTSHMFNRKVVHISCQTVCSACMLLIGALQVTHSLWSVQVPWQLLLFFLCCYYFTQGFGVSIMVYMVIPEIFSVECRNSFTSILMFEHFAFQFITTKLYPVLVDRVHFSGWAFAFGTYSAFIAIFWKIFVPESKGRNIQQIFSKLCKTNVIPEDQMKPYGGNKDKGTTDPTTTL
uniref:Facilitated trehalose transporter Tret1-2 homolog n=1 Tax=Cacopsylla melanoneura TaxID=428564 RepID=A0A8D8S1E0_9HEMI